MPSHPCLTVTSIDSRYYARYIRFQIRTHVIPRRYETYSTRIYAITSSHYCLPRQHSIPELLHPSKFSTQLQCIVSLHPTPYHSCIASCNPPIPYMHTAYQRLLLHKVFQNCAELHASRGAERVSYLSNHSPLTRTLRTTYSRGSMSLVSNS